MEYSVDLEIPMTFAMLVLLTLPGNFDVPSSRRARLMSATFSSVSFDVGFLEPRSRLLIGMMLI